MFERGNGIEAQGFRKHFGLTDINRYDDQTLGKALRYGCERVDLESGNTISQLLRGEAFPGGLTKLQGITVLEAAAWCANHMIRQGLEWLRGSQSISLGQISTAQTNPDEPDYFPPFLRNKLVAVGLIKFIHAGNLPEQQYPLDPMWFWKGKDTEFYAPSLDFLKKTYLAKRGQNSLQSRDGSVEIKAAGGVYDGMDISTLLSKYVEPRELADGTGVLRYKEAVTLFKDHLDRFQAQDILSVEMLQQAFNDFFRHNLAVVGEGLRIITDDTDEEGGVKVTFLSSPGKGGGSVDYDKIKRLIADYVDNHVKPELKTYLEELAAPIRKVAEEANTKSEEAVTTSQQAVDTSQEANTKSEEAVTTSQQAVDTSQEALDKAAKAEKTADSVRKDADEGKFKGDTGDKGVAGDFTQTEELYWRALDNKCEDKIPFSGRRAFHGNDLALPTLSYNRFCTLISPVNHTCSTPNTQYDAQALVFGCDPTRYTSLAHVIWDDNGRYTMRKDIFVSSGFKENEDLGDIISAHRQLLGNFSALQTQVQELQAQVAGLFVGKKS